MPNKTVTLVGAGLGSLATALRLSHKGYDVHIIEKQPNAGGRLNILKQDGFLLFEGYLRMLDISDKSGETSYNVNLYSEVVALADVLGDKTFSELDFTELEHEYQKTNIKNSWNDTGTGITYTNASTSGFRDANSTVKYPFVDWNHQWIVGGSSNSGNSATVGNPELTQLEQAFRPFINIKYLIIITL